MLPSGEVVAAKRLSESFYMGINEFYNEILLLPNLQHQNITKLLGHCSHTKDKLLVLVYEFMENRSLDTFIGWCLNNLFFHLIIPFFKKEEKKRMATLFFPTILCSSTVLFLLIVN